MGVLDQVTSLKSQSISDNEISRRLQEEGVSPAEITEALGRAQIKSAVSDSGAEMNEKMQPSILKAEEEPERLPLEGLEGGTLSDEDLTPPKPGGYPMQRMVMPRHATKEISEESEYSPEEVYSPQSQLQVPQEGDGYAQYTPSVNAGDTDTIIEVAEQVFFEKNKPLQKKMDEMTEFRTLVQTKVDNISDRLRRIETVIDKLQSSILEKVGSYGQGLETVRKEMGMMQDSFGKVVNKLADVSETRHPIHPARHTTPPKVHRPGKHVTIQRSVKKTVRKHSKR